MLNHCINVQSGVTSKGRNKNQIEKKIKLTILYKKDSRACKKRSTDFLSGFMIIIIICIIPIICIYWVQEAYNTVVIYDIKYDIRHSQMLIICLYYWYVLFCRSLLPGRDIYVLVTGKIRHPGSNDRQILKLLNKGYLLSR